MVEVLQKKRDSIAAACERHGVARLEAFGSALREDYKPGQSDLDLLVDFRPMDSYARVEAYFALLDELRARPGRMRASILSWSEPSGILTSPAP